MKKVFQKLKNFFIPHEENEHHPHILQHKSILAIFYFVIFFELLFLIQIFFVFEKTNFLANVLPGALTTITNEQRTENNLPHLKENELLKKAATLKAEDMAEKGYFSHNTPDGKTPWYWLNLVGYKYSYAGENLAVNFFDSYDVARAWMNSPSHRANIIKPNYTEIGIGVANGKYKGRDTVFVVQFFGKPEEEKKSTLNNINIKEIANNINISSVLGQNSQNTKTTENKNIPSVLSEEIQKPEKEENAKIQNILPSIVDKEIIQEEGQKIISEITPILKIAKEKVSLWQKILLSPIEPIKYTFGTLSIILGAILLMVLFIKNEIKHPKMVLKGLFLFSIIVFLFILNINASLNKTIINQEAQVSSFIAS